MPSPHWTICAALETHLTTWAAANWSAALVQADFQIERLKQLIGDDNPTVIGIVPMTVEDQADRVARRCEADLIRIGVIVISRLADLDRADLITIDTLVSNLRLRLQSVLTIPIGVDQAELERASLDTAFDSQLLSTGEYWASLIVCEYSYEPRAFSEAAL